MFALECCKCMHNCTHQLTWNEMSVILLPNVNWSFLQSGVIIPCIGPSYVEIRPLKNEGIAFNLLPLFWWNWGTRIFMSHVTSCFLYPSPHEVYVETNTKWIVECIQCVVEYAQNESERKNYCMCAARTSKIEFSTTVNSTHNHSFSLFHSFARSPAHFYSHIDAMRRKFVLVVPICVLDKRSLSLLCFGSALLLLFRIVFMRFRMFSSRSHSVLMVKTECTTSHSNFCDFFSFMYFHFYWFFSVSCDRSISLCDLFLHEQKLNGSISSVFQLFIWMEYTQNKKEVVLCSAILCFPQTEDVEVENQMNSVHSLWQQQQIYWNCGIQASQYEQLEAQSTTTAKKTSREVKKDHKWKTNKIIIIINIDDFKCVVDVASIIIATFQILVARIISRLF